MSDRAAMSRRNLECFRILCESIVTLQCKNKCNMCIKYIWLSFDTTSHISHTLYTYPNVRAQNPHPNTKPDPRFPGFIPPAVQPSAGPSYQRVISARAEESVKIKGIRREIERRGKRDGERRRYTTAHLSSAMCAMLFCSTNKKKGGGTRRTG